MRKLELMALFVSVFGLVCTLPSENLRAADAPDFMTWAFERSSECDASWDLALKMSGVSGASGSSSAIACSRTPRSMMDRTTAGAELSHRIIESTSFIHKVAAKREFLPRSTRERNDAWRGVSSLSSPADARLSMSYDVRRPLNSSVQVKSSIRSRSESISRPKLNSFGRKATFEHRRGSGAAHPAYRCSRPRIL